MLAFTLTKYLNCSDSLGARAGRALEPLSALPIRTSQPLAPQSTYEEKALIKNLNLACTVQK